MKQTLKQFLSERTDLSIDLYNTACEYRKRGMKIKEVLKQFKYFSLVKNIKKWDPCRNK